MPEEETPDDDLEMIPASPGHEPPREVRESDVLLPGMEPDTAPPVEDTAPDAKVSEGESEKVVAPPPQFDLFEELPGEDWIEIEVNIEEDGYSTSDLDEFAPNLLLDKETPETSKSESNGANLVDSGPDATDATGSGEQGIDGNDVPRSADMAAESQVRTSTGQVEPSYCVPAAEEPKGLLSRRVSLPLPLFVGLLILIAGITYGLATLLRPADGPVDAGDTAIRLVDIESQFVQNQEAGNLLVITGRAINDYDHPRNFIRVTGKVYTSDRFVQSLSVFCGNTLSDEELQTLSTADIVTQLLRRASRDKSNMNIATGSAVPLMIVFPITADMIDRLDSYTVEVIESKPS